MTEYNISEICSVPTEIQDFLPQSIPNESVLKTCTFPLKYNLVFFPVLLIMCDQIWYG